MTRTPKTLLLTGAAVAATSIGLLAFAQPQPATPPGVDPATHAAHLQQNPGTHAPVAVGDANADLASQVAALRGEIAEIRAMLTQQFAAPARANVGGTGMNTMPKQPGGGQMQPQPSRQPGGMAGMSAGGKGKMQQPMSNGQSQPMQAQQPGHPATHGTAHAEHDDLVSQMAVMRADVSRLQVALAQQHTAYAPAGASGGKSKGMGGMDKMQKPMGSGQMQPMQSQPAAGGTTAGGMPGMSGGGQPAPAAMPMMDDDKDEMAGMGSGAAGGMAPSPSPAGSGMAPMQDDKMDMGGMPMMGMDKDEMGGMGAAPAGGQPAGGMGGAPASGGMGGMMKMMGMGGMPMGGAGSPAAMAMPSALPGFPGASHIYHIAATGFFLDHPEHITLTIEQQTALSQQKEQALLRQSQYQRRIEEAEQDLWVLTAADQPDAAAIDTKVQQIAKLHGDQRIAFIRAAGEAARLLNAEQRQQLTGMLPPAPTPGTMPMAPAAPAAAPMAGMPDM